MQTSKYPLSNQNSCGQGRSDLVFNHPLFDLVKSFGYYYSHSTNTGVGDNKWRLWHTFRHITKDEHTVGFYEDSASNIITSCSSSSGYKWGVGGLDEFGYLKAIKHLENKRKRYKLYF